MDTRFLSMSAIWGGMVAFILGGLLLPPEGWAKNFLDSDEEFTEHFPLTNCTFLNEGTNVYFPLIENRVLEYDNMQCVQDGDCDELEELTITVTEALEHITFQYDGVLLDVYARVVEELELVDSEFAERSRNFFVECEGTRDVVYLGEEVELADGSHPGEWRAGQDGALPGIIMPGGAYLLGARYYQEIAPNAEALDRAEHAEMGLEITVPAGTFQNCVKMIETTPVNKHELSEKWYCPNVGLVKDGDAELTSINP